MKRALLALPMVPAYLALLLIAGLLALVGRLPGVRRAAYAFVDWAKPPFLWYERRFHLEP